MIDYALFVVFINVTVSAFLFSQCCFRARVEDAWVFVSFNCG